MPDRASRTGGVRGGIFLKATLIGADMRRCKLAEATLVDTLAEGVNLGESDLPYADFSGAHLEGAVLAQCNMMRANLHRISDAGAFWDGANVIGVKRTDDDRLAAETFKT
jgi:uncharacterized protein YjbI with pentapeptide repeats